MSAENDKTKESQSKKKIEEPEGFDYQDGYLVEEVFDQ